MYKHIKTCFICKEVKPLKSFDINKDELADSNVCKDCSKGKQCARCREVKLLENFKHDSSRKDGFYPTCRTCINIITDNGDPVFTALRRKVEEKREQRRIDRQFNLDYLEG